MQTPTINTSIEYLKGVGPKRAEVLRSELQVNYFKDLLYLFPFRYIDRTSITAIRDIRAEDSYIQLKGKLHGSPIPPDDSRPILSLLSLTVRQSARLSVQQSSESIRAQLWALGLLPGMELKIVEQNPHSITIESENKVLDISKTFAGNINVSLN